MVHVSFRFICFAAIVIGRTSLKDGSITVGDSVEPGARLQLFVRDRYEKTNPCFEAYGDHADVFCREVRAKPPSDLS